MAPELASLCLLLIHMSFLYQYHYLFTLKSSLLFLIHVMCTVHVYIPNRQEECMTLLTDFARKLQTPQSPRAW